MQIVLLVARLLLALVFGLAGISKAADAEGSRRALIGFGVSEKLAPILGRLLPIGEIVIAIALIPLEFAWLGSIAALILLSIFAIAIAINLARGRAPDCHCFGQLHSEPVGWPTLVRNLVLIAGATLVVIQGNGNSGASAFGWTEELTKGERVSVVLGVVAIAVLVSGVAYMRRILSQQSMMLASIEAMKKVIDEDYAEPRPIERADAESPSEGLPVGAPAPSFSLVSIGGQQVTLDDLLANRKPVLLVFVSPGCAPCKSLLPMISVWDRDYSGSMTIALLSKGTVKDNQDALLSYGARHLLLQGESGIDKEYEAKWTPAAVLIRPDGKIASQLSYGDEAIRELVSRAVVAAPNAQRKRSLEVKGNGHKPQITIGTPHALDDLGKLAPAFSLPDVTGSVFKSDELVGRDALLLFWDPKCPYCRAMSDDLERWEQDPPRGAPRLIVISTGDEEAVKAEASNFKSTFLYDQELEVGLLFGTHLTPSAVLIDKDGRIASGPTPGRVNILTLAGVRKESIPIGAKM